MTELSLLPLSPDEPGRPAAPAPAPDPGSPRGAAPQPLHWPAPLDDGPGWPLSASEDCMIEGLNDKVFQGRLIDFDEASASVQLLIPPARSPMRLRFSQFRQLTLLRPVAPPPGSPIDTQGPVTAYHLRLPNGKMVSGQTLAHVSAPMGLFLFQPADTPGRVLRSFCPRGAFVRADFGPRLGELLVAGGKLSTGQLNAALAEQQRLRGLRLGEILVEMHLLNQEQLDDALAAQRSAPNLRLGELLVGRQVLDEAAINKALAAQSRNRSMPLGELLVRNGLVDRKDIEAALAGKRSGYRWTDPTPPIGEVLLKTSTATPNQITETLAMQEQLRGQRLGEVLLAQKVVTPEQLAAALEAQSRMPMVRIGEALVSLGTISETQLSQALSSQGQDRSVPLGELLVRQGLITREDLGTALVRKMGYPQVDIQTYPIEVEALKKLPPDAARRLEVLPLALQGGRLVVAIEDPSRRDALDEVEFLTQSKIVPVLPAAPNLAGEITHIYVQHGLEDSRNRPTGLDLNFSLSFSHEGTDSLLAEMQAPANAAPMEDETAVEQSDSSLVRLINSMIVEAHGQGVSDIHIETPPGREKVRVRFRVDGALQPYLELPHTYRQALIARLKIMCDLDISERRRPQDGKINFARFVPTCPIELRVAMIPTANGLEDAVLRILASSKPLPIDSLGMSAYNLDALKHAITRPYGMVLCVGPTGSGKTTTLHSALSHINTPERKIWTAEDPVEITQAGLRQVQVNPKIDWTFAKALRAFLRADPDVIMVGEIRDAETADIAVESSLTGHLVLSTLHTNSAPETITRLLDMGMDPFNFADSLLAVLAQRLVRRICSGCRTAVPASDEQVDELLADYLHTWHDPASRPARDDVLASWIERFGVDGRLRHWHGPGCDKCKGTGLKGRAGLHELLQVSKGIRRLIQAGARAEEIQLAAMAEGMRTLRQDGIDKVLAGVTSLEEVRATSNG